jgi:hypothetical protein
MHLATMTGLDEKFDVGIHKGHNHGYSGVVGEDDIIILAESF